MSLPILVPAVLCLLALAVLVGAEVQGASTVRAIAKSVASAAFVATGLAAGLLDSAVGTALFVGLLLGTVGDLLLLSDDKRYFLGGLVAFLLNHVAYLVAFLMLGVSLPVVAVSLLPLLLFSAGVWRWLGPHTSRLRTPVLAYIVVITAMVALAAGTVPDHGPRLLIGAILFFVSDLAVARHRFIVRTPANKVVGLPLYYLGQLVFALHEVF